MKTLPVLGFRFQLDQLEVLVDIEFFALDVDIISIALAMLFGEFPLKLDDREFGFLVLLFIDIECVLRLLHQHLELLVHRHFAESPRSNDPPVINHDDSIGLR